MPVFPSRPGWSNWCPSSESGPQDASIWPATFFLEEIGNSCLRSKRCLNSQTPPPVSGWLKAQSYRRVPVEGKEGTGEEGSRTSHPRKDSSSSSAWLGQTQPSKAWSCFCCGERQPQEWPNEAPGSAVTVFTAKGGIYQKWHKNQEFGTCLQSLNHLTEDTLSGTVQAYCQSSICCQQNRLIQYFGLHREEKHRKG